MELRKFGLKRYKGYAETTQVEFAPLTILVGANNSGKTALAQALQLFAGGLVSSGKDTVEPLPLMSGGIRHGETFEDLVTGRAAHGRLDLSVTLMNQGRELSLSATVGNVIPQGGPSERQILDWGIRYDGQDIEMKRQGFDERSLYKIVVSGTEQEPRSITWRGLIPLEMDDLASWIGSQIDVLRAWATGIRHLQCPRVLLPSPFTATESAPLDLGPNGRKTPLALATDDALREAVREWYHRVFGASLDVVAQGNYFDLVARGPGRIANVRLDQSGRGLSHVLPVVVTALTAAKSEPGVDIIEHPEAELHPAAHAEVAELLLESLAGRRRPMVVETHSEMILLRVRRWIAEERIPAESVLVYWIHREPGHSSAVRKIRIDEKGEIDSWPDGVFIEDYEEIIAIRRAARRGE